MIHKIECATITCDGCNDDYEAAFTGFTIFLDESTAEDCAKDDDWHVTDDGKHYCPKCHDINDNDQLILKGKTEKSL
ncbi:hypothetical protein D3C87_1613310 [compost metagenome]